MEIRLIFVCTDPTRDAARNITSRIEVKGIG